MILHPGQLLRAMQLVHSDMWWKGPPFLLDSPELWPSMPTSLESHETNLELTKTVPVALHSLVTTSDCKSKPRILIDLTRFSSMTRLLKVTAYIMKLVEDHAMWMTTN